MSSHRRFIRRTVIGLVAAAGLGLGPATALAAAHVEASSRDAVRGSVAVVSFQVPNESTTGAATTALTVDLTNVAAQRTETMPGWAAVLDRDTATGIVRSVTWTAAANAGIAVGEFGVFRISVRLPDTATVSLPATQTYDDGLVVKWDQPTVPGQPEPEHPAPTLYLAGGATPPHADHAAQPTVAATPTSASRPQADNSARILAGAALLLGAVAIGAALIARRS
jgi:uncharacterized protein YcnI